MKRIIGKLRDVLENNASSLPLSARRFFNPLFENSAEELAYWRLRECGFRPDGIVDVGAYVGEWTIKTRKIFRSAPILMIEAQADKRPRLEKVCDQTGAQLAIAVLGDVTGQEATFFEMETGSSLLPERSDADRTQRKVFTETLDDVVAAHLPSSASLLLKIDVQGAEMLVLQGGEAALARTAVLQLELALLSYNEGAPDLLSVLTWLDERGLVPYDIAGTHRPRGLQPVQIDMLFVQRDSALRPSDFSFK